MKNLKKFELENDFNLMKDSLMEKTVSFVKDANFVFIKEYESYYTYKLNVNIDEMSKIPLIGCGYYAYDSFNYFDYRQIDKIYINGYEYKKDEWIMEKNPYDYTLDFEQMIFEQMIFYNFTESGEYTIKISFEKDKLRSTFCMLGAKYYGDYIIERYDYNLSNLDLSSISSIDSYAFQYCYNLTSIIIPSSVTEIGNMSFMNCSSLIEITCLATTAPSLGDRSFYNIAQNGVLKVPSGSDYSTWMEQLSSYNWTIEYI